MFDLRKDLGVVFANLIAGTMIFIFIYNSIVYMAIFYKLQKVSKTSASADQKKYQRSIQTMMFFVAAFIGQWWAFIVFSLWSFFSNPYVPIVFGAVTFSNMGGVFNFLIFMYIQKRKTTVQANSNTST